MSDAAAVAASAALAEIEPDVLRHLLEQERSRRPNPRLIDSQPDIEWWMRSRLLTFLIEAQHIFGLRIETLALAVSIVDRYQSRRVVYSRHYQLVGCVALWIAAKFKEEKRLVPSVADLAYLCVGTFAECMFREMEYHILNSLDWVIDAPTTFDFIYLLLGPSADADHERLTVLSQYICEAALYDRVSIFHLPSKIAFAAVTLARTILDTLGGADAAAAARLHAGACDRECLDALAEVMASPPLGLEERYEDVAHWQCAELVRMFYSVFRGAGCTAMPAHGYSCYSTDDLADSDYAASMPPTPEDVVPARAKWLGNVPVAHLGPLS